MVDQYKTLNFMKSRNYIYINFSIIIQCSLKNISIYENPFSDA